VIAIDIRTSVDQVARRLGNLAQDIRQKATVSAVNKTIDQGRTQMIRSITREFNVTAGYVRERLRVRRASLKQGAFLVEGSLIGGKRGVKRSANIIAFVERKTSLAQAKKRRKAGTLNQLFVKVKRTGPAKPLKGAFIGNKGRTVFEREGKARLPIKPVQVIDVGQMFNTRRINGPVRDFMQRKFPEVFEREAKFYVSRFNQK
jgi:hypothetical protein